MDRSYTDLNFMLIANITNENRGITKGKYYKPTRRTGYNYYFVNDYGNTISVSDVDHIVKSIGMKEYSNLTNSRGSDLK